MRTFCRILIFLFLCLCGALSALAQVTINEILLHPSDNIADNSAFVGPPCDTGDGRGQYQAREWIELYNVSFCDSIDISGWIIGSNMGGAGPNGEMNLCDEPDGTTHNDQNRGFFIIPEGTKLGPLSFLTIGGAQSDAPIDFAFRDYTETTDGDHPNYQGSARYFLNSRRGWIGIWQPDGTLHEALYWALNGENEINSGFEYERSSEINHPYSGATLNLPSAVDLNDQGLITYAGAMFQQGSADRFNGFSRQPPGGCLNVIRTDETTAGGCGAGCIEAPTPPLISIQPQKDFYCENEPVRLIALENIPDSCIVQPEFLWEGGGLSEPVTGPFFLDTLDLNYEIRLTISIDGCEFRDTASIEPVADLFPSLEITADTVDICGGDELRLENAAEPLLGADYNWRVENATVTDSDADFVNIRLPDSGVVEVELTAASGACSSADTFFVEIPDPPANFWNTTDAAVCQNDTLTIAFSGENAESLSPEILAGAAVFAEFDTTGAMRLVFDAPGTFTGELSIVNKGCQYREAFEVNVWPEVSVELVSDTNELCVGDTVSISAGYNPPDSLLNLTWSFDAPDYLEQVGQPAPAGEAYALAWQTPGDRSITAEIDNPANRPCVLQPEPLQINVSETPELTLSGGSPIICEAETLRLASQVSPASATVSYAASNAFFAEATADSLNFVFPYNDEAPDSVMVFAQYGACKDSTVFYFVVAEIKSAQAWAVDDSVCVGESFEIRILPSDERLRVSRIESDAGFRQDASRGDTLVYRIPAENPGRYDFQARIEDGGALKCVEQPAPVSMVAAPLPEAAFNVSIDEETCRVPVPALVSFTGDTTGLIRYYWDFDGGVVEPIPEARESYWVYWAENGTYEIALSVENAYCVSDTLFQPLAYDQASAVNVLFGVPNVFTPNGDGANDCFQFETRKPDCLALECKIFDRWGRRVSTLESPLDCWSGECDGGPCPEGVYFYQLEYQSDDSEEMKSMQGSVTLLR